MSIRIVRLGTERLADEGLRLGTVRRPPRGVPRSEFSSRNWYDLWFPNLAPSLELMQLGRAATTDEEWAEFARRYCSEMQTGAAVHDIALLAALSRTAQISVGCYCEREERCHRSILRELLQKAGAMVE